MMRLFWSDGRLSWPLVIAVVLPSLSLVVLDFVWRIVVMPVELLLTYAVAIEAAIALLLILFSIRVRRRKGVTSRGDSSSMERSV